MSSPSPRIDEPSHVDEGGDGDERNHGVTRLNSTNQTQEFDSQSPSTEFQSTAKALAEVVSEAVFPSSGPTM